MAPDVSIVTPSYNQGRFIARTIESVLSQEYSGRLEYLVMDGGSRDETVSILKRYGPRIQWVSEKDRGQGHAVNKGIARASGEVIGWINSDDIYYPGAVAAVCEVFADNLDIDVVYGSANHIDVDDRVIEPYPTEAWNLERLFLTCYLCQPAVFFRKRVVERFGGIDESLYFCMDYDYWLRLGTGGAKFFWLNYLTAGSRMYAENKTLGNHARSHVEINNVLRKNLGRVPAQWLFNYAHTVLDGRGVSRADRPRFPLLVSALSLYASARWNHRISREVARTAWMWTGAALREYGARKFRR